ncbi:MAG: Gfo/Idh/MocA family oxidoreductase [Phycisphaeraceae bacterium]|nr:Gfo/Idh/MocA family oxidoreductase [Phycisphaeraceae bacterium]
MIDRRTFLAGAGATALSMASGSKAQAQPSGSKIKLGVIGCGGRGQWIAGLFQSHGGYTIHACSDYFQDRVDTCGEKFGIPASRRFPALSGYKRLLESGVQAVAIISPPYFHPEQAQAAVDAGLHVYLAKPIAVDVPGCKTIKQSGRRASRKKQCFLVDFQTRTDEFYMESVRRVHEGAIGDLAFGEAIYHAGIPWGGHMDALSKNPNDPETKVRAWGMSQALSGDIIVEQNIHTLDVMSWIMKTPPLYVDGSGARSVRPIGNCYDHFTCLYQYENQVGVTFSSRQFPGHGVGHEGIRNRMFGSKGVLETEYGGQTIVHGKSFYRGGSSPSIYKDGAVANINTFHKNIQQGIYTNDTVAPSVQSNLISVMGRTAAYQQKRVTWTDLMADTTRMEHDMKGLKA